jgi:hypothetical protein
MSRQGEMKDKYDKIRELQEQRDRREREAQSQSEDLDAILEASREAHGEIPLVSSSKLSGPGFASVARKTTAASPEDAYSSNFERSRFANPEAFSRTRHSPAAIPDGSISGMQQRTITGSSTVAQPPPRAESTQTRTVPESTVTTTVKAQAPSKTEVTQVVRRRAQALGNRPRREPAPVAPANLATPPSVDGPAISLPEPAQLPQLPGSDDAPVTPERQRVTFTRPQATAATSRMVTNRPTNYGTLPFRGSPKRTTDDTTPFGSDTRRMVMRGFEKPDDTSPGPSAPLLGDSTSPGPGDSTAPGGPERDTSPGMGDTPAPFEHTSPGTFPGTQPGTDPFARGEPEPRAPEPMGLLEDESDPFWRDDVDYEPVPVQAALVRQAEPVATASVTSPVVPVAAKGAAAKAAEAKPSEPKPTEPKPTEPETTENDARYKRVREIDALIARFAADVEVKVGQGRDNTFLRKRSEIVPPAQRSSGAPADTDDDFLDERTQPRHRNIEVRRENTEIIPRRLPPRKRK